MTMAPQYCNVAAAQPGRGFSEPPRAAHKYMPCLSAAQVGCLTVSQSAKSMPWWSRYHMFAPHSRTLEAWRQSLWSLLPHVVLSLVSTEVPECLQCLMQEGWRMRSGVLMRRPGSCGKPTRAVQLTMRYTHWFLQTAMRRFLEFELCCAVGVQL